MSDTLSGRLTSWVAPPWPGPGPYPLAWATWNVGILVALLGVFLGMFAVLRHRHPRGQRALAGFLEAAWVDVAFLAFSVLLVLGLSGVIPDGNRTAWAIYRTVLGGYWLTFSIPVVTVGSAIHSKTRGGVPWLFPSVAVAIGFFFVVFSYYFYFVTPG